MPPEPPPWDRKDLVFRDRKHEKGPGSLRRPRWRDAYHGPRDFPRSSPRRPPPGHYRQGSGYHQLYPEDSGDGHGCTPTRPGERYWPEDKGFRPSSERYGGRSRSVGSVGRESRGSFRRSPYWDSGSFSRQQQQQHHDASHPPPPNYRQGTGYHQLYPEDSDDGHGYTPPRPADRCWPEGRSFRPSYGRYGSGSRSTCTVGRESRGSFRRSPNWDTRQQHHEAPLPVPVTGLRSVAVPISSPPPEKDHHDSSPGDGGGNDEAVTGQRTDPDHSLALMPWKPHKWNRSCSLSLSQAVRSEPDESGPEVTVPLGVPSEKETPVRSPEELAPADEALSRKRQRLGWGEGLAKYERKKDGSEDVCGKSGGLVQCSNIVKSVGSDTSPKILGLAGSASPMTPTSLACSSSPGMEKLANADDHTSHYRDPSCLESQTYSEEYILNSVIADLLQPEDAYSGDSSFSRHAAMSKLLLLKDNISKELEKTENDIDLLEGDLKALKCGEDIDLYTSPFAAQADKESCQEKADGTSEVSLSKNHVLLSSAVMVAGESILHNVESEKDLKEVEGAHGYCLETGSSEVDKAASPLKGVYDSDTQNWSCYSISVGTATSECTKTITFDHKEEQVLICDPDDKALQAGGIDADVNTVGSSYSKNFSSLIDLIMTSNRDAAKSASQVFDRFKRIDPARCDIRELGKTSCQRSCDAQIKEKLAKRKSFLKFKEQVLAIRYRVAHNMWREDLRLLSLRKQRKKSQKRFDLSNRLLLSGSQKHRSSLRSRYLSLAGKPTLIPTTEMINFVSKMLSESQIKIYRNSLKMPACILFEERRLGFTTNNGLIEDPVSFERERTMINPWSEEEKALFMDMLSTFGKDFTKISSFLKHKTAADCIEFYYKNHKSESFRKVKRSLNLKKQSGPLPTNTYLVASGKKWKREANSTSLNMLETAAVIPVRSSGVASVKQLCNRKHVSGSYHEIESSQRSYGPSERAQSPGVPWHVRETAAANVLAGICGAVSSEAMSSCVTSCIDPAEKVSYRRTDHLLTSEVTQTIDEEETCSGEGCVELDFVDWNDEEKSSFIRALNLYGKDFARISLCVRSRSSEQCKIFFSKARKCLSLDVIHREPECGGTPASDTNGGRSDTEEANVVEVDSGICSTQSCSKSDTNVTQVMSNTIADGFGHAGKPLVQIQMKGSSDNYDVGVLNEDEVETKDDKLSLASNEGKSESEVENLQSCAIQQNGGYTTLRCNGFVLPKVSNPLGSRELKKELDSPGISLVKPSISECMEPEHLNSQTSARVIQNQTGDCFPAEQSQEVDVHQLIIPKTELENGQEMKIETDSNANGSHPISSDNCQHLPSDLLSYGQKNSISVNQDDPISNSVLPDSSSICFGDHHRAFSGLPFDFEKHGIKHPSSLSNDLYQHCVLGNTLLNQPLHVLSGYPLQVLDREMLKDSNSVSPVSVETKLKKDGISDQTQLPIFDSHPERCNDSMVSSSRSDLVFSSRSEELSNAQLRPYSQNTCSENGVQSNQSGDVKLFGKILRHPSSLQKSNSYSQGNNSKLPCPKQNRSSTMKGDILTETTVAATVPESSSHLAVEDMHLRSCGFWDGNIIQTGLSKLPESAIFLAKCQGSVGGVPSYSSKDVLPCSDGVLAGYQQAYMQELHKRNGFELVSGSQQQSRAARLGMNLVGGGPIMVGGAGVSCTGVTDPVAALKMHYAARAKILGEVDSWRGDVGGR